MNYRDLFENLGIFTKEDLFKFIQTYFKYGWIDVFGKMHSGVNDALNYSLQEPCELLNSKKGICWDITELCRCFFQTMTSLDFETYYIFYDDDKGCPSHSILVYYENNKVYWFEPMFNDSNCYHSGIFAFDSVNSLINSVIKVFLDKLILDGKIKNNYDISKVFVYEYDSPSYHINGCEMRNHIDLSRKIEVSYDRKSL